VWRPVLWRLPGGRRSDRVLALTIDDAPMPDTTPRMLDLLESHGAKATFFLSGCRAGPHPELIDAIHARGHAIYAHGWDHIRLDHAGPERLIADMDRCETLLARYRPTPSPYLVRIPYNAGWRNRTVHRALARWHPDCQIVHWSLSTEDHLISTRCESAADVERECRREVDRVLAEPRLDGTILLMHDQPINERPGAEFKPLVTVTLLRQLLDGLAGAGYRLGPVVPRPSQPLWARYAMRW
jgi:peptidoglycan/xylan/chitin deacetylase (PgdA/CDA1 family)